MAFEVLPASPAVFGPYPTRMAHRCRGSARGGQHQNSSGPWLGGVALGEVPHLPAGLLWG